MRQVVVSILMVALLLSVSRPVAAQATGSTAAPSATSQTVVGQGTVATPGQTVLGGTVQSSGQSTISGTVLTPGGDPLGNATVRARDLLTGEIGGSTRTAVEGQFSISLKPGSYVLEIVDDAGQIIGTSSFISAVAGTAVAAATLTAASGVVGAALSTATGVVATLGATAAKSVGMAAAAAGVAGVTVPAGVPTASPSR